MRTERARGSRPVVALFGSDWYPFLVTLPTPRIEDYGVIGDAASAALVSRDGSIDWLCWPNFHSPSLFARLLDEDRGGHFSIRPVAPYQVTRRYLPETAILETTFETESGCLVLTDFMVALKPEEIDRSLFADHRLLRRVACTRGEVRVEVECDLRPDYARKNPSPEDRGPLGFFYTFGAAVVRVASEIALAEVRRGVLFAEQTLYAGEARWLSLCYDSDEPAVLAPLGDYAERQLFNTKEFWAWWVQLCSSSGPYRTHLVRSLITLKLLTFSSSGAIVAATTTSLPEQVGGTRNWDYRYCWPRDAVFTLRALSSLGYSTEAKAFFDWLMVAVGPRARRLRVLFDVFGGETPHERTLEHLRGYRDSRPVRIGNGADEQFQLDIYGEILLAAEEYVRNGGTFDSWQMRLLSSLGRGIERRWQEPDAGIWEKRSGTKRHTYSLLMCWAGLDALLQLAERGCVHLPDERKTRAVLEQIRSTIESRGYDEGKQSYVDTLDGEACDASLLLMPVLGYVPADHPRMARTFERIDRELSVGELVHRYRTEPGPNPDGLSGQEASFAMCAFWAVEYLALAGRLEEAEQRLDALLRRGNDLGLFAEEIEVRTGALLGNFPQAFTHVGLIHAVGRVEQMKARRDERETAKDSERALERGNLERGKS